MMRYSIQPRKRIFVKGYGFLPFAKNMGENIGKNISKSLSGKYSPKLLDHTKQSDIDALKTTSKRVIQKQQKQLVIADRIRKSLKNFNTEYFRDSKK